MILAGPGVLMGAFMMGLFIYYCTNLGWSWYVSMLFGSILSGTDPVAVVALLKDVNTSPRLFLLIIGESLLNDGTCIVMYTLYFDLLEGKTFSPRDIIAFFVKMLCASPALGVFCGLVSIYCLRTACRSLSTTDRTIQIIVTVSCSYLAFYFSEKLLHLSGILACGAAGLMISKQGMPYLVDHETIHLIWELLEWFGNTMIFFLAGVVYGGKAVHYSVTGDDFALLILIYVMLMIMRAVTVACLYPFISVIGLKCSLKEAIFMSWSGLRGALGMALGLAVFGERELLRLEKTTADKFFFFVGGICTLTLLINALTAPYLLEALGLILTTNSSVEFGSVQKKVDHQLKLALEKEIEKFSGGGHNGHGSNGHGGAGEGRVDSVSLHFPVNTEEVKRHISLFDAPDASSVQSPTTIRRVARQTSTEPRLTIHGHLVTSDRRLVYCRHMFLTILRAQYWKSIHEGRVPRNEKVAQCLLYSVEHSIHNTAEALSDWSIVCKELSTPQWRDQVDRYLLSVTPEWFSLHNLGISESAENTYDRIYILINYISAHEKCQHEIYEFLDDEEQLLAKRHSASARPPSGVLAGGVEGEDNNIWLERSNQKVFHEIEVVIDESKANVCLSFPPPPSLHISLFPSTL
jgi:NhaP-type Na+/H+ or K+/H+ antiporter